MHISKYESKSALTGKMGETMSPERKLRFTKRSQPYRTILEISQKKFRISQYLQFSGCIFLTLNLTTTKIQ
jgi:hypothetical protein